jgi:hypothetical protein
MNSKQGCGIWGLARDYERLTTTLKGWHWLASLVILIAKVGIQSQ